MSYLISWLSGIIISVILTSVLTVILRDEIQRLVSEKLGPYVSSDDRSISGIWEVVYLYCSEGEVKSEKHIILLNQIGSHVVGKNLTSEKHKHRLTGKLDQEKFYTGRWDNLGSDLYYGAFQFFVKPDGREMNGLWIGFDSSNTIRKGYWKWSLIDKEISEERIENIKREWIFSDKIENFERDKKELMKREANIRGIESINIQDT